MKPVPLFVLLLCLGLPTFNNRRRLQTPRRNSLLWPAYLEKARLLGLPTFEASRRLEWSKDQEEEDAVSPNVKDEVEEDLALQNPDLRTPSPDTPTPIPGGARAGGVAQGVSREWPLSDDSLR